ncbi:hypothetical protein [Rhizobium sophorae]|uniref:hypothetical protein n=1 Tax=Rhizobium sophorae TaxID=1535242 RepID=UPI001FE8CF19|nr:hypothetical protein [Rhizobium sophorae]
MRQQPLQPGWAYAIIGNVTRSAFYEKAAGAMPIPNSAPGITPEYSRPDFQKA